MHRFNTEDPVRPDEHYSIPPLDRMDLGRMRTDLLAVWGIMVTQHGFLVALPA